MGNVVAVADGHHVVAAAPPKKHTMRNVAGVATTCAGPDGSVRNVPRGQRKLDSKKKAVLAAAASASDTTSPPHEKTLQGTSTSPAVIPEKPHSCATPCRKGNCRRRRSRS